MPYRSKLECLLLSIITTNSLIFAGKAEIYQNGATKVGS
jgi:hypothetical protein